MSLGFSPLDDGTVADWLTEDGATGKATRRSGQPTRISSADSSIGPIDVPANQGSERAKQLAKRIAAGIRTYRNQHPEITVADLKASLKMLLSAMERGRDG